MFPSVNVLLCKPALHLQLSAGTGIVVLSAHGSVPWISSQASAGDAGEVSLLQPLFLQHGMNECIPLICSENQIPWGDPQSHTAGLSFRSTCPTFGPITCFWISKELCSHQPLVHQEIATALPPSSPSARSLMSSSGCSATTGAWHTQESLHKTSSTQW